MKYNCVSCLPKCTFKLIVAFLRFGHEFMLLVEVITEIKILRGMF